MKNSVFHGEIDIDYVFYKAENPSPYLVIEFPGKKIQYGKEDVQKTFPNFLYQLLPLRKNYNLLFFIDGFFPNIPICPYICLNGKPVIETSFISLVNKLKEEYGIREIIAIGISGGGAAAVYYAIKYNWYAYAVSTGYYLGDDKITANKDRLRGAEAISGLKGYDAQLFVSEFVLNAFKDPYFHKKLYFGIGIREQIYEGFLKLLSLLGQHGIEYEVEGENFSNHAMCVPFMKKRLAEKVKLIFDLDSSQPPKIGTVLNQYRTSNDNIYNILNDFKNMGINLNLKNIIPNCGDFNYIKTVKNNALQGLIELEKGSGFKTLSEDENYFWEINSFKNIENLSSRLSFQNITAMVYFCDKSNSDKLFDLSTKLSKQYFDNLSKLRETELYWFNAPHRILNQIEFLTLAKRNNYDLGEDLINLFTEDIIYSAKTFPQYYKKDFYFSDFLRRRAWDFSLLTFCAFFYSDVKTQTISNKILFRITEYINYAHSIDGEFRDNINTTVDFVCNCYYKFIKDFYENNGFNVECEEYKAFNRAYQRILQIKKKGV